MGELTEQINLTTLAANLAKHKQPSFELLSAALEQAYILGWNNKAAEVRATLGLNTRGS